MEWISRSPEETMEFGRKLLEDFPEAQLICLQGPLGSGKTCFTKGVGAHLNIPERAIKSPTFTTLFEHKGIKTLYHCDFYRHDEETNFAVDWWMEILEKPNSVVVVEWSERIEKHLPKERIEIEFIDLGEKGRKLILKKHL